MSTLKTFVNKYPLQTFFVLLFVISWGVLLIIAGPKGFPVTGERAVLLGMAILLGPTIAGIFLSSITFGFRYLLSRLSKWRIGLRWYLIAILTAPVSTMLVLILLSFFSSVFQPSYLLSDEKSNLLMMAIFAGLTVGIFEELGWTGFAVPTMKKHRGVLATGLIIGLVWGFWHFPLFWQTDSFVSILGFSLLLARLFSWLPPYRVLMVWVYDNTESLLAVILMHLSLVATLLIFDPQVKDLSLLVFIVARAIVLWGAVGLITLHRKKAA